MPTARRTLTDTEADVALRIIKTKVGAFLGPPRRPREHWLETSDLVQDALVRVLSALPNYDPTCASLATFISRVTDLALQDYLRRINADKRNPDRPVVSLTSIQGEPAEPSREGATDLRLDLREHCAPLSESLRSLIEQLRKSTIPEIAAQAGIHRGTVYRQLGQIRKQWESGSLREYLDD